MDDKTLELKVYTNSLNQKGNLAYEYNPFHNYQTNINLYNKEGFYIPEEKAIDKRNGQILDKYGDQYKDKYGNIFKGDDNNIIKSEGNPTITKDSLMDLDTQQLNFDLNHPVNIEVQPSYDGSVNLILNDDKNVPRLINSRFSVREKNTYEIVDRIGENDTNIYSSNNFDKDTSLYFQYKDNPIIEYKELINGVLPVGQYCFYFTYCDADDNESDYIAESGLIPIFIGQDGDKYSMDGGIKNQQTNKGIKLKLTNLDNSFNYIKVYYVRYFADYQQNRVYECKKINRKYLIGGNKYILQITGEEPTEDVDANILNVTRFNPKSILTQAQCKNMLFFGNIVKNTDNYKELQDCALRIIPKYHETDIEEEKYYKSSEIYNSVGYFNNEYYRFGVVFIYQNGTLSNVYNTLGYDLQYDVSLQNNELYKLDNDDNPSYLTRNYIKIDDEGFIINNENIFNNSSKIRLNSKGICKFPNKEDKIYSVKFDIPDEIKTFLQNELGIRGLFFVRQKRIPNVLAQCYILPMDETLEAPIMYDGYDYFTESFLTQSKERALENIQENRLYKYKKSSKDNSSLLGDNISSQSFAGICPDFLLNQPYYNQIFNGSKFRLKRVADSNVIEHKGRMFTTKEYNYNISDNEIIQATICTVTEDVPTIALDDKVFKLEMGKAEEVFRFKYAQEDKSTYNAGDVDEDEVNEATNLVRGKYSPYLAIKASGLKPGSIYSIYQDNFLDGDQQFLNRMNSSEPFYAISDRYNWENLDSNKDYYRGDCYYNTFTYRLNRNFNDSTLPNNDQIIDKDTWKDNYDAFDQTKWKDISRSDVNAVQLGNWITFNVKSYMNYALRSEDFSYVAEAALMGSPRSFYPRKQAMWLGNYKMPDSYLYNDAYRATLGFKYYFTLNDVNYIKNTFSNRIQYSSIAIQDSFKNNYRESLSTYFRDYSQEYGSIQKLVGFEGYLLVIFEHSIGIAVINERVLVAQSDGEPVFINSKNVLPEELTIITDTYGTQWPESVVKSEAGYVYGIDTVAKKIWRVKGQQIEILSDFKVNKFLVDNISLEERELYPIIGLKNVKSHYNNNKKDIMFTFYDNIYEDEEKTWNLCYNELLGEFTTFYSWIPSYSENINTQFFTFNRNTSKYLTLLSQSNYYVQDNTGVLLESVIIDDETKSKENEESEENNIKIKLHFRSSLYKTNSTIKNFDGLNINAQSLINKESENVSFEIQKDRWGYYKYFDIDTTSNELSIKKDIIEELEDKLKDIKSSAVILYIRPTVDGVIKYSETIALSFKSIVKNLTTDFYLHGQSGIFNVSENLYPTYWYGEQHPFEFEFVVNDKIGQQKLFSNLVIISNKAEPESFHFEIEGDNYEFSSDKRNMYFRQEATKNLYQNLGSDMIYDRKFTDVISDKYTQEQYYRSDNSEYKGQYKNIDRVYPIYESGLVKQIKSTIFPLYYKKVDTYNEIYDKYTEMVGSGYDFKNLSGSEIKWNRDLNQFNIVTHIKNSQIDLVGNLRGNSRYKEGKWNIQIPSIIFNQKNESEWIDIPDELQKGPLKGKSIKIPPIVINSSNIPEYLPNTNVSLKELPNIYQNKYNWYRSISNEDWTYRKETKIRDKWIKIRIRYSGKNLAIIHSLITLYNISYS